MESKSTKANLKSNQKPKSIRINPEVQKKAEKLLLSANKKKAGRKIKVDQLLNLALDLVSDEHIKRLQDQSLSNEDRKEQLRQRYIEMRGPITCDEFTGFMLTKEFSGFLVEQSQTANAA